MTDPEAFRSHAARRTIKNGARPRIIVAALCVLVAVAAARAQEYTFENLSVADGLAQSQVYAMCQDARGVIWFGTRGGGACAFDGVSFTAFGEENGLVSNYIRSMLRDRDGAIWFGTDAGLTRYDGRACSTIVDPRGPGRSIVSAIVLDAHGVLWVGTLGGGLFRCDRTGWRGFTRADGLPGTAVQSLYADIRGRLWVGLNTGLACFDGARFRGYTWRDGLPRGVVSCITGDRTGAVWIGTYGGGIARIADTAITIYGSDAGLNNTTVQALLLDSKGTLWVGTAGGGVNRFDGRTFTHITETEGLCNNVVASIMEDDEGDLWIGSSGGGVSRLGSERFMRFSERQGYLGGWVYAITQDRDGAFWFGHSGGGVTRYDGRLYARFTAANGCTNAKVRCIAQDSRGTIWLGTMGDGLYAYRDGTFRHASGPDDPRTRFVSGIAEDARGRLWLATADAGIVVYDPRTTPARVRPIGRSDGLAATRTYAVFPDADGTVWAGTDGAGAARITADSALDRVAVRIYTTADGLRSNTVRSITRGPGGTVLFGTGGGGIALFNGGGFRSIVRSRGALPSNNIYALARDRQGYLWIGSEKGLARLRLDSSGAVELLREYGRPEGVTGIEVAQNAACVDRDGNIWFGTIAGAVRYSPKSDRRNEAPPKTHITEVRLFFTNIAATPYAHGLAPWYPIPAAPELPYDQNQLSFDFVGISQRNPARVTYQWKLEGAGDAWSPRTAGRTAVFSNLEPGSYTFLVRSFNEDGVGSPRPAAFSFAIRPPFWGTWWFRAGAIALLALGLAAIVRAWLVAERRRNERERRELQTRRDVIELEQKALHLTMNPHFIFNALTSIGQFVGGAEPAEARRYLAKFSKLMRRTIENAREPYVSLQSECAMLTGYLELELLSASSPFTFEVSASDTIDGRSVAIPSMLVQPLVENAVGHGLRHRGAGGHVAVRFSMAGALLRCSVEDNGVGRERAALLEHEGRDDHRSAALEVTRERLAIMARQSGLPARLELTDLRDDAGNALGTRADVYVPYTVLT